jgi:hypothetical protein
VNVELNPDQIPPEKWRRFTLAFLRLLLLLLCGVATLNFGVNPMSLYPTRLFPAVLMNSRADKIALLRQLQHEINKPKALIIGSSRVMKIEPSDIKKVTGYPAFNAAVDSAMAEDYYALVRFAEEKANLDLRMVILGLDVEAFHNARLEDDRVLAVPALRGYLGVSGFGHDWKAFTELFERQQTSLSLHSLRAVATHRSAVNSHFESDGYLRYDKWERDRQGGSFDLQANIKDSINEYGPRFRNFSQLSAERLNYLERTIRYCFEHGIAIIMFVTPLHPDVIASLPNYEPRHRELQAQVGRLCAKYSVPLLDYSDIAAFGGNPRYFYDGGHVDERNSHLIVINLFHRRDAVQ